VLDRCRLTLELVAPEADSRIVLGRARGGPMGDRLRSLHTPLHSILHEAAHYICMTPERLAGLDADAGGDDAEESAACYLQVLLADHIRFFGRARMLQDMDAWGYSYRLGSARAWFETDAEDARDWLFRHALIDAQPQPTWKLRE
jgi:hypothetical protein